MASVAVPMITSKAIGMVGEKMGLDPRLTAVASAAGGFGAGTAYSSYSGAKAINSVNDATSTANSLLTAKNQATSARNIAGNKAWESVNQPIIARNNQLASDKANFFKSGNFAAGKTNPAGISPEMVAPAFRPEALKPLQSVGADTTFGNEWDKNIDRWKTRPTDDQGREIGMSNAENLGAEMLSTVMSDLPEEPRPQMIGGGGGGGGGSVAPYRGGGGFIERKVLSNLGGNRERRFKPQGI